MQAQAIAALQTYFVSDYLSLAVRKAVFTVPDGCGIEMVYLARLLGMPQLLPFAFYAATSVGGGVTKGWKLEDGTWRYLELDYLYRFIEGYATLRQKVENLLARVSEEQTTKRCKSSCRDAVAKLSSRDKMRLVRDIRVKLLQPSGLVNLYKKHPICQRCTSRLQMRCRAERGRLWVELPAIFNLNAQGQLGGSTAQ